MKNKIIILVSMLRIFLFILMIPIIVCMNCGIVMPSVNSGDSDLELLALVGVPSGIGDLGGVLAGSGLSSNKLFIELEGLEDGEELALEVNGTPVSFNEDGTQEVISPLGFFEGRRIEIETIANITAPRTCFTENPTFTMEREDITVSYNCGLFPVPIRGTINGLTGSMSLTLNNPSATVTVSENGLFSFGVEDFVGTEDKSVTINSYSNFGEIYCEENALNNFTVSAGSSFSINCYENLIQNFSFENGLSNWQLGTGNITPSPTIGNAVIPQIGSSISGSYVFEFTELTDSYGTGTSNWIMQCVNIPDNSKPIEVEWYVLARSGNSPGIRVHHNINTSGDEYRRYYFSDSNCTGSAIVPTGAGDEGSNNLTSNWERFRFTQNLNSSINSMRLLLRGRTNDSPTSCTHEAGGCISIDDVFVYQK